MGGYEPYMRTVRLAGELESVIEARRLVEDELGPAGAGEDTMMHTQLLVTELVTNAARHAQTPVDLTIATTVGRVRIEARDGSAAMPVPQPVDTPTRHRGMQLIEDLSDGWGVDAQDAPGTPGKVVWCELTSRGLALERPVAELP
jgi:two-component sensor histidine kinase